MGFRYHQKVESISAILARWLGKQKKGSSLQLYAIQGRWSELVGERLATRAQPTLLTDRILTITVVSSAWLNELNFLKEQIRERINALGEKPILGIRLVCGKIDPQAKRFVKKPPDKPAPLELPPRAMERIDLEASEIKDDQLREAIKKARLAQLQRNLRLR